MPSLMDLPSHPSRSPPSWSSAPYAVQWVPTSCLFHTWWCMYMSLPVSRFIPPSPSPRPHVLYVRVSTAALQTSSSVPFFYIPCICANILYLFFSFSFCMTDSRSIHISTNDSLSLLFMAEWYSIVYIYVLHLLFPFTSADRHLGGLYVLLKIVLQWTWECMCFFELWFLQGICQSWDF